MVMLLGIRSADDVSELGSLWTLLCLCALQYLSVKFELVLERHAYALIFDTPFAEVAEFFYDHYKALNKF
jgi:hypothetical protein